MGERSIKIPLNIIHLQNQEECNMLQQFTKYGGSIQAILGLLGNVGAVGGALGATTGGNIFNILSGGALGFLGFKGSENAQRNGALGIGAVNAIVGLLGAFGMNSIAGIPLTGEKISWIINLVIGAWGLIAGFMKKKA